MAFCLETEGLEHCNPVDMFQRNAGMIKICKQHFSLKYKTLQTSSWTFQVDDLPGAVANKHKAQQLPTHNIIGEQDADRLIKLTLDYPASQNNLAPSWKLK